MKSTNSIVCLILMALLSIIVVPVTAQVDSLGYITVSGIVKDRNSKRSLSSVNVSLPDTHIGTVTNDDGYFSLKLKRMVPEIVISHLGYHNQKVHIDKGNMNDIKVMLVPHSNLINEIVVVGVNPVELILEALERVPGNYSDKANNLTGFYRETAQKGKKFINVSEAVVNVYKGPYKDTSEHDRVQILKGRRLVSQKASDTLGVKLVGGPTLCLFADLAKNRASFLDKEQINNYYYRMKESTSIDNHPQYVISFWPKIELPDEALFFGKIYIDKDNLAFSRIEYALDMSSRYKATRAILYKKPVGLRFKPQELSFVVNYKIENGVAYLNYVRNNIGFKCDWKRRLFAKSYMVVSEIVVTDQKGENVNKISHRDSFDKNDSFYDKASDFSNDNFWEDYNIIEPTESLEHAVDKLKKQLE